MFDAYSDGYCPQCLLENKRVAMSLNRLDFWECPTCHLQAAGRSGAFMVLRKKGQGEFRETKVSATDTVVGAFLLKQSETVPTATGGYFKGEEDFRSFLEKEVQ